jgi:hypothetical protein
MIWAALSGGDRLAASVCGRAREVIAPMGARRGALRVLDALVRWQRPGPAAATPATLSEALDALQRTLRPGSHVLLLIDPRSVDLAAERSLTRMRAHHDLVACLLADALEHAPPPPARYRVSDGARRETLALDTPAARSEWVHHFQTQQHDAIEQLRRAGVRARLTFTHEDPVHALHELLSGNLARSSAA